MVEFLVKGIKMDAELALLLLDRSLKSNLYTTLNSLNSWLYIIHQVDMLLNVAYLLCYNLIFKQLNGLECSLKF